MRTLAHRARRCAACGKGKKGPSSRDGVIAAWKKGGLEPSPLTAAQPTSARTARAAPSTRSTSSSACTRAKDAKAAEDAGLNWVGDTTGASQAQGETLIVVADRRKADPSGRRSTR